jgi:cytochrome P450
VWLQTLAYGVRPVEFVEWCHRRHGDVFAIRLPGKRSMVVFADPRAIGEVMALRPEDFTTSVAAPFLAPILGEDSILLLDGERHKAERKALVDGLHAGGMSEYAEAMAEATLSGLATWPVGEPFALHSYLQAITLEVIARLIMGVDDEAGREELLGVLRPWLALDNESVAILWEPLRRNFGGHGPWARFVEKTQALDEVLYRLIARRRQDPALGERRDLLSIVLAHASNLDEMSLRDQLLTMLAAGHDTSATALAWAFILILRHPDVLKRLVAEVDAGDDTYLDAVVKEVLRLRPVILECARALTSDMEINGTMLRTGTVATGSILLAQRRPDIYEEPGAFRPERFLGRPADPHTWLPFGGGVRRCIGAAFATLEIKTVLRTVLSTVELDAVGPMEKPRRRAVTMIPSRGARVVVHRFRHPLEPASLQLGTESATIR